MKSSTAVFRFFPIRCFLIFNFFTVRIQPLLGYCHFLVQINVKICLLHTACEILMLSSSTFDVDKKNRLKLVITACRTYTLDLVLQT